MRAKQEAQRHQQEKTQKLQKEKEAATVKAGGVISVAAYRDHFLSVPSSEKKVVASTGSSSGGLAVKNPGAYSELRIPTPFRPEPEYSIEDQPDEVTLLKKWLFY